MKLSESLSTNYELFALVNGGNAQSIAKIQAKKSLEGHDFFACFDSILGFITYDKPEPNPSNMTQLRKFASMLGNKMKRGGILWFNECFDNGFVIVDNDNWAFVYKSLVPKAPISDAEWGDLSREKEAARAEKQCRKDGSALAMFQDAMPENRYKKLGKRGFRAGIDKQKHDHAIAEFDKAYKNQAKRVFGELNMNGTAHIYYGAEDAAFARRQAEREANQKPLFTKYTD